MSITPSGGMYSAPVVVKNDHNQIDLVSILFIIIFLKPFVQSSNSTLETKQYNKLI